MVKPLYSNSSSWLLLWGNYNKDETSRTSALDLPNDKISSQMRQDERSKKDKKGETTSGGVSGWLGWKNKNKSESLFLENSNAESGDRHNELGNEDEGNEVERTFSDKDIELPAPKKASTWSFWNNTGGDVNNGKAGKPQAKPSVANTILQSSAPLTSRFNVSENVDSKGGPEKEGTPPGSTERSVDKNDNAVLYKAHDDPKQFKKINTHKNENLKANAIVPEWDLCLPSQNTLLPQSLNGYSTSNRSNSSSNGIDYPNWWHFLSLVSARLGFNSKAMNNKKEDYVRYELDNGGKYDDEYKILYGPIYKLYGKCLEILPFHKRACLPNYNKFYRNPENQVSGEGMDENDEGDDPNSISISNDPMGNLLINQKADSKESGGPECEIVSSKKGSLRKIKKILIIGVHGFFPTKVIRPFIGAPKGTSLKFANEAEKAVIRYCEENGMINENRTHDISIQKIALEKEDKIFGRVEFFTEVLEKWSAQLNEADCIFFVAHSQGVVVTIILLARLIKMGILKDPIRKRIGILSMAGVNNGPFYGADKTLFMKAYKQIEHESLLELFKLTDFNSTQSIFYKESIHTIINANVKICFIGSINDQLVPLYSALAFHIFHPNIYRACYIDHSSHTPLFIQKLVSLSCQLLNLGFFDNNVIKELSTVLAGPLTGGGHSKIYNDGKVYDLGVRFLLDTDDIVIPRSQEEGDTLVSSNELLSEHSKLPFTNEVYIKEFNISKIGTNQYILPWCLRGLLFNIEKNFPQKQVKGSKDIEKSAVDEISELYELFDNWKPESKGLKELKFRLNGIRASRL